MAAFQRARGAAEGGGAAIGASTWHLLASGCNASLTTGALWFDAGWPQVRERGDESLVPAAEAAAAAAVVRDSRVRVRWQGSMSTESLTCMRAAGFRFATFECWLEFSGWWPECAQNIKVSCSVHSPPLPPVIGGAAPSQNAQAAGMDAVGAYMFPIRLKDPGVQVGCDARARSVRARDARRAAP